jgi:hypothetical protein
MFCSIAAREQKSSGPKKEKARHRFKKQRRALLIRVELGTATGARRGTILFTHKHFGGKIS